VNIFFKRVDQQSITKILPVHFNARGVVENPVFSLVRPTKPGDIEITIRAHCLGDQQWIAEGTWGSLCGHLPFDGNFPNRLSQVFKSRSEAVEAAIEAVLLKVKAQLGSLAAAAPWNAKVASAIKWAAEAVHQTRLHDESLVLHGLTVIDLCAGGLGGFGLALTSLGAKVTLACEIDPEARSVYAQNIRPDRMHDDLCTLDGTKLSCDILTIGLLCQAFSTAGKRQGFADPVLANAYTHSLRLLREIDAKVVIVECARQLLTQDGGKDAEEVRLTLMKAGYRVQHRTLNAAGFGLAQSRERSFIVATRIDLDVDSILGFVFPQETAPIACVADILESDVPATLDESQFVMSRPEPETRQGTLVEVGLLKKAGSDELCDAQGYRLYSPMGLGATLTASGGGRAACTGAYLVNGKARGLTPREASRMQGMPEWAAHHRTASHALKHAGNAVAVPVARELGRQLSAILGHRS
jgi:DNA (cytosine-5)-methyltransferase 1